MKTDIYIAHINEHTYEVQTVKEHSENTANLCREFAIPELKNLAYVIGLLHDLGKYQPSFQRRIRGEQVKVEHSLCGAKEAEIRFQVSGVQNPIEKMIEFIVAGHHGGIPDGGTCADLPSESTLHGRLRRDTEEYHAFREDFDIPELDIMQLGRYLVGDSFENSKEAKEDFVDKYAFLTRYLFSCLTDADSLDTANFCDGEEVRHLSSNFENCLRKVNERLYAFQAETELQRARARLQQQVFDKADQDSEFYLMNMPTGSGKTLCSVKFALERAIKRKKKRIIYIIPYNSIIEQTANEFESLFGADMELLRHQSTFSYEDRLDENGETYSEEYIRIAKLSTENWDADFIVTTMVQFLESVYGNRRGKLRKLHNMGDSVLIFDEAHLMPRNYLQPCLQAIAYLTRYLHSEAVFLTATMPDFRALLTEYAIKDSKILELVEDKRDFEVFRKCHYQDLGTISIETIVEKERNAPSRLIVVNTRATARKVAHCCSGKVYHLSTYMTAYDRSRVIESIRQELKALEYEFGDEEGNPKNVPEERRITVISTSLIEAGVDLDFHTVFRELTGLDSILQAGGRCNREGKRKQAEVFIFQLDSTTSVLRDEQNLTKGLLKEFDDISCPESIEEYYRKLNILRAEDITKNSIHQYGTEFDSVPFRTYADCFVPIDSRTVSLVVGQNDESKSIIDLLRCTGTCNSRRLQKYACTVYQNELEDLIKQNAVNDFDTGVWCLVNSDYYDEDFGIQFEAVDYII